MATGRNFSGSNHRLGSPPGMEEIVTALPCLVYDKGIISCWQLSDEEKAEIARTGVVWLHVMGHKHPPVFVSGTCIIEAQDQNGEATPYDIDAPPPVKPVAAEEARADAAQS
jgi:hypothetical protein